MINVKAQMVPVIDKAAAGPDYRIFAGDAELGHRTGPQAFESDHIRNRRHGNLIFKSLEYLFFAGLVLLFEYIFFQYSVLKYHIITDKQIQYLIYKQFDEFVSNYYIINQ